MVSWFTVKQLYPGLYGIAEFRHFEKVVSYLFVGDHSALLFDSGTGTHDISKQVRKITKLPVTLLNSHCHYDHIGGNHSFSNVIVFDSWFSKKAAKEGHTSKQILGYFEMEATHGGHGSKDKNPHAVKPFGYSTTIKENQLLKMSPFEFKVIHTPGHTPDSICLYEKKNKLLLTGDTIYPGKIYLFFKESDTSAYFGSLKKISAIKGIDAMLPAHNAFYLRPDFLQTAAHRFDPDRKVYEL